MSKFKSIAIIAVIVISGIIGFKPIQEREQQPKLSALAIANIEALTQAEGGSVSEVGGPNGGYYSTGNSIRLEGTSFDAKEIKYGAEMSIGIYPSYDKAKAALEARAIIHYRIDSFMWVEYDCDKSTKSNCVVCFRYRI